MPELRIIAIRRNARHRQTVQFPRGIEPQIGLRFRHDAITDRWFMWLVSTDGTEFHGPLPLVPGIDLLRAAKYDPRVPQGELFVSPAPPTADTADTSARLYYRPPS